MLFESVRQLLSTIRIKLSGSSSRSEKLDPCGTKVSTRDASTSCGEPASVLGYLDAAVQVNEVMLIRTEREYGLFELGTEDEMSQKPGLPIIHQYRRRPEAIPEETIVFERPVKERRTTSSPPKSALRVTSQESSSADSLHSNKTGSDTGSSKSKQVSWEQESDQRTRSSDAAEGSTLELQHHLKAGEENHPLTKAVSPSRTDRLGSWTCCQYPLKRLFRHSANYVPAMVS